MAVTKLTGKTLVAVSGYMDIIDEEGNLDGHRETVPAGTTFTVERWGRTKILVRFQWPGILHGLVAWLRHDVYKLDEV